MPLLALRFCQGFCVQAHTMTVEPCMASIALYPVGDGLRVSRGPPVALAAHVIILRLLLGLLLLDAWRMAGTPSLQSRHFQWRLAPPHMSGGTAACNAA